MKTFLAILFYMLFFIQLNAQVKTFTPTVDSKSGCLSGLIYFQYQEEIDSFPLNYPECDHILGSVQIVGDDITNLYGLGQIKSIDGWLEIHTNQLSSFSGLDSLEYVGALWINNTLNLNSLSGLDNLDTIGTELRMDGLDIENMSGLGDLKYIGNSFAIGNCNALLSLFGLENLHYINNDLWIANLPHLINLEGMSSLSYVGGHIRIYNDADLTSLSGLLNLNSGSIHGLSIYDNPVLNACTVPFVCEYLSNPSGEINIFNNAAGCENPSEIADSCGFTLPCLPFGNYYLLSQEDIDSFHSDYHNCNDLMGTITIQGEDIDDLSGIQGLSSVGGSLFIKGNPHLASLSGLDSLKTIGESLYIGYYDTGNPILTNLEGLENLESVAENFGIIENYSLVSIAGLDNLFTVGNLQFYDNPILSSLNGLNNLDSVQSLDIRFNDVLSDISILLTLSKVNNIIIIKNPLLESLYGLDNIIPDSINLLDLRYNSILDNCAIKSICNYLSHPGSISNISDNSTGCKTRAQVEEACHVSINELYSAKSVSLFPNPANSLIFIKIKGEISSCDLRIFNLSGKQVISRSMASTGEWINIGNLPTGIYQFHITGSTGIWNGRFVKME